MPAQTEEFRTLAGLLRYRALHQPDRLAFRVLSEDLREEASVTYRELHMQAAVIAAALRSAGLARSRLVLLYPTGLNFITAFFGTLYSRATAIPLNPPRVTTGLPRIEAILADAQPAAVLTDEATHSKIGAMKAGDNLLRRQRFICTDRFGDTELQVDEDGTPHPEALAFIQYTSGSTALPRGARISHVNALHNASLIAEAADLDSTAIGVSWLPLFHDMGLMGGIVEPLFAGFPATLLSPVTFLMRPIDWLRAITRYRATVSAAPNFAYDLCVEKIDDERLAELDLSTWTTALSGAETVRAETLDRFAVRFERCGFRRRSFFPCYGLAEATLLVSGGPRGADPIVFDVDRHALENQRKAEPSTETKKAMRLVACGRPAGKQDVLVVDGKRRVPCAENLVGEIWLRGPSISDGYWSSASDDEGSFGAQLASGDGPFLRTGDLGFLREGRLFVTGRIKDLIIIRGANHYPQDIEATAENSHPALRKGHCAAFSVDLAGAEDLVIVQELKRTWRAETAPVIEAIRHAITDHHGITAAAVVLIQQGTLPKTSSGKVQRYAARRAFSQAALRIKDAWQDGKVGEILSGKAGGGSTAVPLQLIDYGSNLDKTTRSTVVAEELARLLKLSVTEIDVAQPIGSFALDSLQTMSLRAAIEARVGFTFDIGEMFGERTIIELEHLIDQKEGSTRTPIVTAAALQGAAHGQLSFAQERMWVLEQLDRSSYLAHVIPFALRLTGNLNVSVLQKSIDETIRRHEVLRTVFEERDGHVGQRVAAPSEVVFPLVEISAAGTAARSVEVDRRLYNLALSSFDLATGPLIRFMLLKVADEHHLLCGAVHHAVADALSIGILAQEIGTLYGVYTRHETPPPLISGIQYADYAAWQREQLSEDFLAAQSAYWQQKLAGAPFVLELPSDRPRPLMQNFKGSRHSFLIPHELREDLLTLAKRHGCTLFMCLLAGFQILLSRWSRQKEVLVGSAISGRAQPGTEELIGPFLNTIALRGNLTGDPTIEAFLRQVRETCHGAYAHQDMPFERLVETLRPTRDLSRQPIIQAMMIFRPPQPEAIEVSGLRMTPVEVPAVGSLHDVTLVIEETTDGLQGHIEYATDLFDRSTIERLVGHYKCLLEGIVASPERRLSELALLTAAERRLLVEDWNATAATYQRDRCVHELFAAQALQTPDAIAVAYEGEELSYRELDRRSNQLAHHLQGLGVGPETVVGLCVERSAEMVVGLLGILKAGGAYLPLDPSYPLERLTYMISDASASIVVTQSSVSDALPGAVGHVVHLDADRGTIAEQPEIAPTTGVHPDNLAYVIYTSGSTGKPKGVLVQHRSLMNFLQTMMTRPGMSRTDILVAVTPLSFDIAGLEIYLPLITGARLMLVSRDTAGDGSALGAAIDAGAATVVQGTPATWHLLASAGWRPRQTLKVLCGGEALSSELALQLTGWGAEVWNLYGPTETTIWSTAHRVERGQFATGTLPLGRPIGNTTVYVLDNALNVQPIGVAGELYIGGVGVARGYLGRPGLTADRFVPSPFGRGERLYRTGDLARWRADGTLDYLGRIDHQVKLRGHRIELGEIEAALEEHPKVQHAVVVAREEPSSETRLVGYITPASEAAKPTMEFGIFFFAEGTPDPSGDKYKLYVEGAKLADRAGLQAIWTPERHFTEVAAAYPNPSLLSAALAMVTERIQLRAGSVVLPLHHPIRVAEEWAVVDNLSRGRVGISFAPGWVPDDFVFAPAHYADRHRVELAGVEQVRRLWRGEALTFANGTGRQTPVRILPRPIQPELPTWLTTSGTAKSFEVAGALGVNVLTALLNQSIEELERNIQRYRAALIAHGFDPSERTVSLMLHTFIADTLEVARNEAQGPLGKYVRSHARLREAVISDPEFRRTMASVDEDAVVQMALKRYLQSASLVGSPTSCLGLIERLHRIGVTDIACLVDFGISAKPVLEGIQRLKHLADCANLHLTKAKLDQDLRQRLPAYMLPSALVVLDRLPLTPNGKIDRRALPHPEVTPSVGGHEGPRNPVEQRLAAIWAEILHLEHVGIHQSFFELGGHSLLATRLVAKMRAEFGVEFHLRQLFDGPTIAEVAALIPNAEDGFREQQPAAIAVADSENRFQPFPLTDIQEAYWLGRGKDFVLGNIAAHSYFEFDSSDLDVERLEQALQRVITRHDMLRATILPDGTQRVLAEVPYYRIAIDDLRGLVSSHVTAKLTEVRTRMSHQIHEPTRWPLFEIRATLLPTDKVRVHISFDILIGDAWSYQIFMRDLARFYRAPDLPLPPLQFRFRDYVISTRSRAAAPERAAQAYWQTMVSEMPPAPALPFRFSLDSVKAPRFERWSSLLPKVLWGHLQHRAQEIGVTPAALLLTAFSDVLATYSSTDQFVLDLIVFDRKPIHTDTAEIIGDFTSMSLLAVDARANASFAERSKRLQKRLWHDLDHSAVGGLTVLRELSRAQGGAPMLAPVVFTSMLGLPSATAATSQFPAALAPVYSITQTPQVALDCQISEDSEGLRIVWDAVPALFHDNFLDRMFESFTQHLTRLAEDAEALRSVERGLVSKAQLALRARINDTAMPTPDQLLHEPFVAQASAQPDAVAVVTSSRLITYAELERRSRHLARRLIDRGASTGTLVAVVMEKGWEQVVCVLGVLRAGAAYLPIDPNLPAERLHYLLGHGQAKIALTQSHLERTLSWPDDLSRIAVDLDHEAADEDLLPPIPSRAADLAYVIYTSGSTGLPKGVAIDHRGALNTILDINRRFQIMPDDRVFAISALGFDLSVYDVFGTLAAGGAIVMPDPWLHPDPEAWARLASRSGITVWNSVPALFEIYVGFLEAAPRLVPSTLRLAMLSGDWIPLTLPTRAGELFGDIGIVSLGGATEASIWSICFPIAGVEPGWKSIPYGKPLANQSFHVLDAALEPRPNWVEGDLYIGGVGLAKGYWRDPEKTAASFIIHPRSGERLYRTGDLGLYLPSGDIEFRGRRDLQVKVQGHRIELGEIETTLLKHSTISSAVVQLHGERFAAKQLIAYVVSKPGFVVDDQALRAHLLNRLPSYMVPSIFFTLAALPLSPNGKLDRKALPAPRQFLDTAADVRIAPRTPMEESLVAIWQEVLGIEQVGIHDNFFELGGQSLSASRVVTMVRARLNVEMPIAAIFERPTIAGLAELHLTQVEGSMGAADRSDSFDAVRSSYLSKADPIAVIRDPAERDRFKELGRNIREPGATSPQIALNGISGDSNEKLLLQRRNSRRFARGRVALTDLSNLMGVLRAHRIGDRWKYRYASAGGLYPVQLYLCVHNQIKGDGQDLVSGSYYYDPRKHALRLLMSGATLDASMHTMINRPVFARAEFSLFLIADQLAIAPIYDSESMRFALIEAGMMAQLLDSAAEASGIGLCHIGGLEFETHRSKFLLDDSHVLLHAYLGGLRTDEEVAEWLHVAESDEAAISERWEQGEFLVEAD